MNCHSAHDPKVTKIILEICKEFGKSLMVLLMLHALSLTGLTTRGLK